MRYGVHNFHGLKIEQFWRLGIVPRQPNAIALRGKNGRLVGVESDAPACRKLFSSYLRYVAIAFLNDDKVGLIAVGRGSSNEKSP